MAIITWRLALDKQFAEHLGRFKSLKTLDLSEALFRARIIFEHLPSSLTKLKLQRLRTFGEMSRGNRTCSLSAGDLAPLRSLHSLETLDFKYSDLIFGHSIDSGLFVDLTSLRELNLGYCRISIVKDGAFEGLSNLTKVILDGYPLGSRQFSLQSTNNRTIKDLSMKRCGMA